MDAPQMPAAPNTGVKTGTPRPLSAATGFRAAPIDPVLKGPSFAVGDAKPLPPLGSGPLNPGVKGPSFALPDPKPGPSFATPALPPTFGRTPVNPWRR